jgi:sulfate adenylyltransferase subunit 1
MVTGASTANAAIVLIDARNGVIEQTHRHAFIASLLGIPHIIVCINKMDLMDYREEVYLSIMQDFQAFASQIFPGQDMRFIPISALKGDNVVKPSESMSWYSGGTLLHHLETIPISQDHDLIHQRFPVQYVIRPESDQFHDYRGYAGRVAGGFFHPGDKVVVLPSRIESEITMVDTLSGPLTEAHPPMSVTLTLKDDVDLSRGDMITGAGDIPRESCDIVTMICWMNQKPLQIHGKYALKHTTRDVRCIIQDVDYVLNISTLEKVAENKNIRMNDIAQIRLRTTKPLFFDPYTTNRITGSLILIDEATNETVAAGMIV